MGRTIIIPDFMIVIKLLEDNDKTMSDVKELAQITYKHLHDMKKEFIENKWVTQEKIGRKQIISLTKQGKNIANGVTYIFQEMGVEDILKYKRRVKKLKKPKKKEGAKK